MNEIFEKIYNDNNTDLNESSALFEKVYTEAEMLNEMNPKLRALLAAGLIGTASLGAASCSMPTDDPTIYEQPAPETTNPDNPGDNGSDNGGTEEEHVETAEEKFQRLCNKLHVSPDIIAELATAPKASINGNIILELYELQIVKSYNSNQGFKEIELYYNEDNDEHEANLGAGRLYIVNEIGYFVPTDSISAFTEAIDTYKKL